MGNLANKAQMMNKGLVKISNELYVNDWDRIYFFMKDFRPTYIEFRHWENDIWYIYGISKMFDELKEGDAIPQYDIIFTQHENNDITYKFERV